MRVGKGLTSALLMIVILWAALPLLACFAPADHSCCPGVGQECSSPASMNGADCCLVQPAPDPALPGHATVATQVANLAAIPVSSRIPALAAGPDPKQALSSDSPPGSTLLAHSILRI